MTLRYILSLAVLTALTVSAQRSETMRLEKVGFASKADVKPHPVLTQSVKAPGDTVFYEDFANGLSGNNNLGGAWTTGGVDGALWMQDFDGPNGDFSTNSPSITSTTESNGFMIYDSNFFNDGCVPTNTCQTLDGSLVTPVMDLSATPNVHLEFETALRWCCAGDRAHYVDVSTDGGASWGTRVLVSEQVAVNTEIYTNQDIGTFTRRIRLTEAIAADPSNVVIRFYHDGPSSGNMSHYFWMIDDVTILESESNDITMHTADQDYFDNVLWKGLNYTVYPFGQLRELDVNIGYSNEGINDAYNVTTSVNIAGPGGFTFSGSDARAVVVAGNADSASIAGFTPPATAGTYTMDYDITMDSLDSRPGDNVAQTEFAVDEWHYAVDEGARDFEDDNEGDAYYLGNAFYIENDQMLYGIDVAIDGTANSIGAIIDGLLLDVNLDPIAITAEYEITTQQVFTGDGQADWITLKFDQPQQLIGGEEYVVVMEDFGGSDIEVATSGRSLPQTSFIYDIANSGGPTWFFVTRTPMVRMNFDNTIGLDDYENVSGVGLGNSFPNPTEGLVTIPYDLENSANVNLVVTDISGKVVMTVSEGKRSAGAYRMELNLEGLSEGTYFYTLQADDVQLTKRLTLTK